MADQLKNIYIVIKQLNKFSPEYENERIWEFLDESVKAIKSFNVDNETFLMEILFGCIEYKPLLDVVVNTFYIRDGKHCMLSERNLYVVVCYLATFQLEELGLQEFSRMVKALNVAKICKFLRFFFNIINLSTWIKDEWSQIYDSAHVVTNWMEPLLRWQPKVQQLIDQLDTLPIDISSTSKITEPKEFNLTVPNPRPILIPELVPPKKYAKQVPETMYKPPIQEELLKEIKLRNRQKSEEILLEANLTQFSCAARKTECMRHHGAKHKERFQAQKIRGKREDTSVKLNTTAILREGVLYQRKTEQELNRLEQLLRGARDPSEFLDWQKKLHEDELRQELAEVECRRLQGKLSYEEAILAHQNCVQKNQEIAEQERQKEAKLRQRLREIRRQEDREKRKLTQQVAEGRKNAKQAVIKLQKFKHQIAQEVSEESRALLLQVLEEEEELFQKRCELIQEIRTMEYLPFRKHKFVDLTQTANYGFLGEMSIVELQERLALLKESQKKAEEEKRDSIIREKRNKERLLLDKLEQIALFREAYGRTAALKQEEKKIKPEVREGLLNDERVLDLQRKIAEKSMERKMQAGLLKSASMKFDQRSKKAPKLPLQDDYWQKLEGSRQQLSKMLQPDIMPREAAQKTMARVASRIGTSSCILRS